MKRAIFVFLSLTGCLAETPDESSTRQAIAAGQPGDPGDPGDIDPDFDPTAPIAPPPGTPTLLSRTDSQISMKYSCAGNAITQEVWRRRDGQATFSKVGSANCVLGLGGGTRSFHDSNVQPETSYCYRVRAHNTNNISWSGTACFSTTAPAVAPTRPPLWLESLSTTSIRAIWRDDARTESYYRVWRRTATTAWILVNEVSRRSGSDLANRATGEELEFMDTGLAPDTAYTYFVEVGYDPVDPSLPTLVQSSMPKSTFTRDESPPTWLGCTSNNQGDCDSSVQLDSGWRLTVYHNFSLAFPNQNITKVVAVVHGRGLEPWIGFGAVTSAANTEGLGGSTLVIAPLFEEDSTSSPNLSWNGKWREGGESRSGGVSSFDAMDELLRKVTDPDIFPNVRTVTVVGHSAGGQFTSRYSATTPLPGQIAPRMRFVITNPSHYLYINENRPNTSGGFSVPSGVSGYDDYPYGLHDRNEYASRISDTQLRNNVKGRAIVYLLGEDDDDTDNVPDTGFVMTPQANVQGGSRWARGNNLYRFMQTYYAGHYGRLLSVPGVGHVAAGMYTSPNGRRAIFY